MNLPGRASDKDDDDDRFVPDMSEGAETGLYLALFELLNEGVIITGDEMIIEVNSAACRLLERDYRELAGRPLADIFPSERAFLAARSRLFIQGEMRGSLQVSLPGTRQRTMRFVAAARIRPGMHVLVISPDTAAEPEFDESPTDTLWPRLAAALEQPVIVVDDEERVAAANAAALRALDLSRGELVGSPLAARLRVEWPTAGGTPVAHLYQDGHTQALDARVLPGPKPDWRLLVLPPAGAAPALVAAKARRPGRSAKPSAAATEQAALLAGLRQAVASNQFELHFQPLVDARDGTVRAGEALLRWNHPDLGTLPFRHFMDVACDGGLIVDLGRWALQTACRHATAWSQESGTPPRVTVNVALEQIVEGGLPDAVAEALATAGLPAQRLELDLDERILLEDERRVLDTLNRLDHLGVRLAVEDFGRGPVSLARLRRFPIRALKLDPALVRGVGADENSEAIVEAITSMAGVLGLEVLARGVEGKAQQAFLSALGCHMQQGALFGQPMTAERFAAYLKTDDDSLASG